MYKPTIGIVSDFSIDTGGNFSGNETHNLSMSYVKSVIDAGGIPLILPITLSEEIVKAQISLIDGLIISGGNDMSPLLYNEEPYCQLGSITPERDFNDMQMIKYAHIFKKPTLGICRGHQSINVYFGGTLYQDLSLNKDSFIKHSQNCRPSVIHHHTVDIVENTRLFNIFGKSISTNSYHHQAIKDVAPNFKICAVSKDNIIEAIEYTGDSYIVGIQWHPEMMAYRNDSNMILLFKDFINNCKKDK